MRCRECVNKFVQCPKCCQREALAHLKGYRAEDFHAGWIANGGPAMITPWMVKKAQRLGRTRPAVEAARRRIRGE